jgi:hypothetical protein
MTYRLVSQRHTLSQSRTLLSLYTTTLRTVEVISSIYPCRFATTAGPASLVATVILSACAVLLSSSVSEERQGSVMANNQALQVGVESLGVFVAGLMASVDAPQHWDYRVRQLLSM